MDPVATADATSEVAALSSAQCSPANDTAASVPSPNVIATRRKKARAICGVCLQEDSIYDAWMQRCTCCDVCIHIHCGHVLGLISDGAPFKCPSCSFPELTEDASCIACLRKLSSKTLCVCVVVSRDAASRVCIAHAPCIMLSTTHRLLPPSVLPISCPAAIFPSDAVVSPTRCFICREEGGETLPCMHASCGKSVHASCAADFKLVWFATARDYSHRSDGPSKIFVACSMKHVKQDQVFCSCLRPYLPQGSTMVQCDDCRGWFHCDCLGIDDSEDDLDQLQSKQFRCSECAAKFLQTPAVHPPIFMCDVRRHWFHAAVSTPPKSSAPSLDPSLPLSNQQDVVAAIAADLLLLITQPPKSLAFPELTSPTCLACLLPTISLDSTSSTIFSTISHRLCNSCRSLRQSLLYFCVPSAHCSSITDYPVHSKAYAVVAQTARALVAPEELFPESMQLFQKQLSLLERLIDVWDLSFRFSSDEVSKFQEEAASVFGNCPFLSVIAQHVEASSAIGLQLQSCLEQHQIDLTAVFNLMQACRRLCCQTPHELRAAAATLEIADISAKIDFLLGCVSSASVLDPNCTDVVSRHRQNQQDSPPSQNRVEPPSLDELESALSTADSLHFTSKNSLVLKEKVEDMRKWRAQALTALQSDCESLITSVHEAMHHLPAFSDALVGAVKGKFWNLTATKIIKSNKEYSLDYATAFLNCGQQLEESLLSVYKHLQQCVSVASEWDVAAQAICRKKSTREDAEQHLQMYNDCINLVCSSAVKLRQQIDLSESWFKDWAQHAEKGFEHMCSLANLRHVISKYSQFSIQLPCDDVMTKLLQFQPEEVKTIVDHSARLLTKKLASLMLKINSGGGCCLIHPENSNLSCPFTCCPWSQASFSSHADAHAHIDRHIEASSFPDFKELFVRNQCTFQEAAELIEQAASFDDEHVMSNCHLIALRDRVAATEEWLNSVEVDSLLRASSDDTADSSLQKVICDGIACGLHTPQLEALQTRLILSRIQQAELCSSELSYVSIEILITLSDKLGLKPASAACPSPSAAAGALTSSALRAIVSSHVDAVAKISLNIKSQDFSEFCVSLKAFSIAHFKSPILSLLEFVLKMTQIWKEKAMEFLKQSPHDSTAPYTAKTILGWMHWIRWFSQSDSISKIAEQLQNISVDYKHQVGPTLTCYAARDPCCVSVSHMLLLWPVDDASDLHLANASGDSEALALQPRCVVTVPLPPRWYTDAAPESNKHSILNRIKKLGSQIIASKILCKRKGCDFKSVTPDGFCSDKCAVQYELDAVQVIENSRIKRRAAARDALSRTLSLSYRGAVGTPESINRLSAAIESSFLRAVPSGGDVLPESYYSLLRDRMQRIRHYDSNCVRCMMLKKHPEESILKCLSPADSLPVAPSSAATASAATSLPQLPALPSLPQLPAPTLGVKRSVARKDDLAPKNDAPSKAAKLSSPTYSISVSGTTINELCFLSCVRSEHYLDVDMASVPSAIVVQGRLAPSAVAVFVNQVSSSVSSSKFIALFLISSANSAGCPPGLRDHVNSLAAMDRVAVAPLGDDCQMYIGFGRQFTQAQIAAHAGDADSLYALAVFRKGKHAARR